jgi:hypothetical protein
VKEDIVKVRMVVILGLAVVLALAVTGCGKVAEKAIEETTGVDVEEDSVTITGDGEEVTISDEGASLPEDFPDDVPVPKGDISSSSAITSGDTQEFYVTIDVKDDPKEAYESLKSDLEDDGYTITSDLFIEGDDGLTGMLSFSKGDEQGTAVVGEGENGGNATITFMVSVGAS